MSEGRVAILSPRPVLLPTPPRPFSARTSPRPTPRLCSTARSRAWDPHRLPEHGLPRPSPPASPLCTSSPLPLGGRGAGEGEATEQPCTRCALREARPGVGARGPRGPQGPDGGGVSVSARSQVAVGPTLLRSPCWPAGGATSPHGSVPSSLRPSVSRRPRVPTWTIRGSPSHSSGCPLPFRRARPWHPGGTGLPGLAWGSAFLSGDSPPLPGHSGGGSALPSTGCHAGTRPCTCAQEGGGPPIPLTTAELLCTRHPGPPRAHPSPRPIHLGLGIALYLR